MKGNNKEQEIKVYIVGGSIYNNYANWIPNVKIVDSFEEADLILFAGGEDVCPEYYNEPKHPTTSYNKNRDEYEIPLFKKAIEDGKYILGICRGSQLACVMNGGKLVQHQQNRSYLHEMYDITGGLYMVTSTHHQAQYPFNLPITDYKVLGYTKNLSAFHKDGNDNEMNPKMECEIVLYPKTKCLAIQSHPEECYPPNDHSEESMIYYMQGLVNNLLKKKEVKSSYIKVIEEEFGIDENE